MKKILILLGIAALIGSCCPCRHLESHSDTTIVFKSDTVYEPDSILYHLDPDTITDSIMVEIIKNVKGDDVVISDTLNVESNFANGMAWVNNSQLQLTVTDKDTTLTIVVDSMRVIISNYETTIIHQTEVIEQKQKLIDRLKHNIRLMLIGAGLFALVFFILIPLFKPKLAMLKDWIKKILK